MWKLFSADGFVRKTGVQVQHYNDGTTRIDGTLHLTSDLDVSDKGIASRVAGWYLARQ